MRRRGFTLIELAMVLAVIGILVSLAVPGYRAILLRARASEARTALQGIADAELRYFRDLHRFLACAPSPAAVPQGTSIRFDAAAPGWSDLGVSMQGAVRYRYQVSLDGPTFLAIAQGDLDGDGKSSTFTLRGDTLEFTIEDELE